MGLKFKVLNGWYQSLGKLLGRVFSKQTLQAAIAQLTNTSQADEIKALSAAFGVFMGITPFWGFQTAIAIFFAFVFRFNKALVVLFSQVSFPPFIPFVIYLSYRAGAWLLGTDATIQQPLNPKTALSTHL